MMITAMRKQDLDMGRKEKSNPSANFTSANQKKE